MAEATTASVRDRLAKVAGPGATVPDPARWAVRGVAPRAVVAPASAEAAAAVLALCSAEGWTVECAGAGTWLRHGRTPRSVDVVLSTSRITGITEYEPADLVIGLGAGTPLDAVRTATAAHAQRLPLDGPAAPGATVGAMLATATAGPLRPAHGIPRDQALGLEFVTGDGRVLRVGGRVVKNVAGYDVVRLLVGSFGTLGVITAAHLRLRAHPERDVTLLADAEEHAALLDLAHAAAGVGPAALELLHGHAAGGTARWLLLARVHGNAEAVQDAVARLGTVAPALRPAAPSDADAAWDRLAHAELAASATLRARTLPATLTTTLDAVLPVAGTPLPDGWTLAAHVLDGTVRLHAPEAQTWDAPTIDGYAAAIAQARTALAAEGGTVLVPVPPPGAADTFEAYRADAALVPLMQRLKQAFDPDGILAPGRFVL